MKALTKRVACPCWVGYTNIPAEYSIRQGTRVRLKIAAVTIEGNCMLDAGTEGVVLPNGNVKCTEFTVKVPHGALQIIKTL